LSYKNIKSYELQNVCTFIDYRGKTPPKTTSGIPLITAKIVKDGYIHSPQEYIAVDYYDEWMRRGIPKQGDIVFTTEAPLGEVALINTSSKLAFAQRIIIIQTNEQLLNSNYLFYALQDMTLKSRIEAKSTGTTVIGIKSAELKKVIIDLPSIEIQKNISAIIMSLDNKIQINNKINDYLEQQGQLLFERIFIEETAELPTGRLSDIAYINPSRTLEKGQIATYVEMANLPTRGCFPNNWTRRVFSGGMKFTNGDTIMARITPCLENGKTAYINFLCNKEVGFGSTEYIVLAPKNGFCSELFYFLARNVDFVHYAVRNMNGSSGRQRVSGGIIGNYEIHIPSASNVAHFEQLAHQIMETIKHNALENRLLVHTRDLLLPRLMSGNLSITNL
jgi:type I restriction enzyme, S subunit